MSFRRLLWHKSAVCAPFHVVLSYAVATKRGGDPETQTFDFAIFLGAFAAQIALLIFIENVASHAGDPTDELFYEEKKPKRKQPPRKAKKVN